LWANDAITVNALRQNSKRPKFKARKTDSTKKAESTHYAQFSADNWGDMAMYYMGRVKKITEDEWDVIIDKATPFVKRAAGAAGSSVFEAANDEDAFKMREVSDDSEEELEVRNSPCKSNTQLPTLANDVLFKPPSARTGDSNLRREYFEPNFQEQLRPAPRSLPQFSVHSQSPHYQQAAPRYYGS
jgi:hypothetical protein